MCPLCILYNVQSRTQLQSALIVFAPGYTPGAHTLKLKGFKCIYMWSCGFWGYFWHLYNFRNVSNFSLYIMNSGLTCQSETFQICSGTMSPSSGVIHHQMIHSSITEIYKVVVLPEHCGWGSSCSTLSCIVSESLGKLQKKRAQRLKSDSHYNDSQTLPTP